MLKYIRKTESKCGVFSVILFNTKRLFRFPALPTLVQLALVPSYFKESLLLVLTASILSIVETKSNYKNQTELFVPQWPTICWKSCSLNARFQKLILQPSSEFGLLHICRPPSISVSANQIFFMQKDRFGMPSFHSHFICG